MSRKETIHPSGVKVVETKYQHGFVEIAVYRPQNTAVDPGLRIFSLCGCISRQIVGGKWVVHTDKTSRAFLSRVKRDAIQWAVNYAEGKTNAEALS